MRKLPFLWSFLLALVLVIGACGDDGDTDAVASGVAETPSEEAAADDGSPAVGDGDVTDEGSDDIAAAASDDEPEAAPIDETNLQERLLDAQPGDVIEIPAGTFSFDRGLSLNVDGVTLRGAGMDETILSFAGQVTGAEGLLVSASDFTIEDLAIEDTVGDALKINEGENVVIRRVRTEWTGGPSSDNGAYGIYPVQITNVLIEESVAIGASDAGIYVGQSNNAVVRNNRVEFNVAGIEIENTIGADVHGNEVTNNTGGILVFNLPGLSQQGSGARVFDNDVYANNTDNFAREGTVVSVVPSGSGVLVMAADRIEIFGNRIRDNQSANVIIAAGSTVDITGEDDPTFDGYPEAIFVYDNELSGGGDDPDSILLALQAILFGAEGGALPSVVWDGAVDESKLVDGEPLAEDRICVQEDEAEVANADAANGFAGAAIDTAFFDCTLELLEPVELAELS